MNNKGFTLVEVLVGVAITAITALAISQSMTYFFQFKRYLEAGAEYNQFLNDVQLMIDNTEKCANSIGIKPDGAGNGPRTGGGFQLNASTISNNPTRQPIDFRVGSEDYDATGAVPDLNNDPQTGIKLREVSLVRDPAIAPAAVTMAGGVPGTSYAMVLRIVGELDPTKVKGPSLKPRDYNLNVIVRNSNLRIQDCIEPPSSASCEEIGGVWDESQPELALKCNLAMPMGGCMQSAGYSREGGNCTEPHPGTGGCTCPDGFEAVEAMDFVGGGGKTSLTVELFACYKCDASITIP